MRDAFQKQNRKVKAVLAVLLVVVAGGIFFTTCAPEEPKVSFIFLGFTNGPQGQAQAVFAFSKQVGQGTPYLEVVGCHEAGLRALELEYGYPLVRAEVPKCAVRFKCGMGVFMPGWRDRLRLKSSIRGKTIARWIPSFFGGEGDFLLIYSPWIPNPYHTTNLAPATPPEQ